MELVLSSLWAAIATVLIIRALRQHALFQVLSPAAPPRRDRAPRIGIVIPARDEAENIGACLAGLVAQDYPRERLRVFVVDDHSCDGTAAIVAAMAKQHPQVQLVRSPPLPPGWIGKSHACWIGAQAAGDAEWLCFMDADVSAQPALLSSAMQQAGREHLDFLSLAPRQELRSFAERLVLPCGLFLLAFYQDLARVQARDSIEATATGQFMLITRASYDKVGGHAAVRGAICEDLELARLVKRSGANVVLRGGERLISTRMYTGWRTLWPGLAKNVVDMLGGPVATAITALVGVTLAWAAFLVPGLDAARYATGSGALPIAAALAGAASAAVIGLHIAGTRYFRIPLWYGLLFPLGYTAGALIALDSLRRRYQGGVTWKGRTYSRS